MEAKFVIDHILNLKEFNSLKRLNKTTKALNIILGANKAQLVRYAYIRNSCLYICTKAAFATHELKHDSTIFSIKNFLNTHFSMQDENFTPIKEVRFFTPRYNEPKLKIKIPPNAKLQEAAKGDFNILCKDEKFKEIFLEIKAFLKDKHNA